MPQESPGTLKAVFIWPEQQVGHPLERFCPPLQPPGAVPQRLPIAGLALPTAAVFDVAAKFVEVGVASLIEAATLRMRAQATTLEVTVPVDGFFRAGGAQVLNGIDGATLVLHNGEGRTAADPSFSLALSVVVSQDRTAFRLRVHIWHVSRFLLPRTSALGQTRERDVVLRIEFLTPGSSGLGTRAAFVELAFPAVSLGELKDALEAGQDLPWMPMPPVPLSLAAGGTLAAGVRCAPFNIRATMVETTKPGLVAKWVEDALVASKGSLSKAAASGLRSAVDPTQQLADDAKLLEAGNNAFTAYRKAWDALQAIVAARPAAPTGGTLPAELAKHEALMARWKADAAIQQTALSIARATAVVALHKAGIGWPGDLPAIALSP